MRYLITGLLLLLATFSEAQQILTIKGVVLDTAGLPLTGVTIKIHYGNDSAFTLTDKTGAYILQKNVGDSFLLKASYSGLQTFSQQFHRKNTTTVFSVSPILLAPATGELEGITITSVRPVIIKEDTVQYDVNAYKVREGAPVEDVIKKLPGVTVDKDGNIEAQGKKVARVRVNGKDFFGGDVQTATQNLPADIIDNIQIIDDYGDQANLTGIKSGDPEKIININTQKNKTKGTFGNATAAVGTEGRYAGNFFGNRFNGERQISFLGAINNTNANLFNFNGGGRGGGGRGANLGNADRGGGGGGAGITLTRSIGINFRDRWSPKLSVYGSYSYSSRSSTTESNSFTQDVNPKNIRTTNRSSINQNNSSNHRLTWNMEYAMDSFNYFKISPYVSYSNSSGENRSNSEIHRLNYFTLNKGYSTNENNSPNAGGNLLYNHKFGRRGRNLSSNFSYDRSVSDADRYSNNTYHNVDSTYSPYRVKDTLQSQQIGTATRNTRLNAHFSYTEPLNTKGRTFLELNYDWNKSATQSLRDVFDLMDSTGNIRKYNTIQSNHFNYDFITNRVGFGIKGNLEKYNYNVGLQFQPSNLNGYNEGKNITTTYNNINWVPSARFVYNFARNNSLTATINGSAREPSFNQLQPVSDSSNLNNIIVGNANLKNEFTKTAALRYNKFDQKAGTSLFVNISYDITNDKIVNNWINNPTGTGRTTTYVNTDGFYGYSGNASYTRPFSNRKYTAGISMSGNFDNNISFTDGQKNQGQNWSLHPGGNFRLDLENIVDLTLRGDYTVYKTLTRYSADSSREYKAQTLNLGLNGKNYFKDLTIGYDISKVVNYGFSSSVNSNPTIVNVYAEYRMLKGKMLTLRLQGFDLLNQNTGVSRTVNGTTITDSRSNRLMRYFLLSANIRLAKFAGMGNRNGRNNENREGNPNRQRNQGGGNGGGNRVRF